ncbi:PREDICTED: uncharacterized protein DDB_G0275275-like [Nicrophorus vespilloides]|uniref:Uncharacterized protein DDB_G0275275-like n=1 Tax=Nicrophorus vespilloides TaxID=110193 RepID=A0ABM1N9S9_NICVS|nr:PREDICTED: uncharacterized protein DDB_G0275275-like [Nicrophorus vespilloides]XP_017783562.1 PREDICTED: uncharacterized protein DDB_G0275275-like [Nicrophorus vespilloides]XP_017783571.1 PREDICTED: uncharacterized protein DDB_G0275275-like [Nicrophorus vespilloides]XP_017783579.1 PREDICTED: uncharacterized protein DDB_G0275275-like [Nicrophorus vespilloides]
MAGKPELSAAPGIQNVVVYVSNDNIAQAYTVNQQNVGPSVHQHQQQPQPQHHHHNNGGYQSHTVAPLVPTKGFPPEKLSHSNGQQQQQHAVAVEANSFSNQAGYFTTNQAVISQNGFASQPVVSNISYSKGLPPDGHHHHSHNHNNHHAKNNNNAYHHHHLPINNADILVQSDRRTDVVNSKECSSEYESGYVVMGGEGASSVRCDSVRSEAAESSCSSLSSADEGMLVVQQQQQQQQQQQPDMVVYDNNSTSVNVRHGVVVAVAGGGSHPSASGATAHLGSAVSAVPLQQTVAAAVPHGWKRLSTNGGIIYIR